MLVLSRKSQESVWIDDLEIKVGWVRFNKVQLLVSEPGMETPVSHILYPNDKIQPAAGISLMMIRIQPDKVRLGIEYPPGTEVRRGEVP
ncbi:carbon storage regulator [Gimesia panareensis]|uniref:carbon storage regulator n=1 Tax=Gimesia panareensis TaxID=2527978 RepID=UPI0011897A30|nr:carbon storage regulator [Gimesia panareensis]QDU53690.1 carbon storage regulator [Gimesia panareensis]